MAGHAEEVAALAGRARDVRRDRPRDTRGRSRAWRAAAPLDAYGAKLGTASYRITVRDVSDLLAAGYSEDAIFELTLAGAIGAAGRRLEAGLRAMGSGDA
jgi:hypothetical protein